MIDDPSITQNWLCAKPNEMWDLRDLKVPEKHANHV